MWKRGCSRFHSSKAASFLDFLFFVKRIPPPPLFFFVHCSVNYCEWSLQFFFSPSVFLDDTMQGISGRKVRLEGGETLQSSLVTMRWFSYRSSRITLFFVSWTFSCFLLHHMFFFLPLGQSLAHFWSLTFSYLLVVVDWTSLQMTWILMHFCLVWACCAKSG